LSLVGKLALGGGKSTLQTGFLLEPVSKHFSP
jgi:hypothetical protein